MATEIIETFVNNVPTAVIVAILVGLLRNVTGWLENSWKDGKIDSYEIKQLVGTMIKYFCGVLLLMYGLPVDQAIAATFGLDIVTSALKSTKNTNFSDKNSVGE